jgi:hypothetical protein
MHTNDSSETTNMLLLAGGLALMVFGAGMLLASPAIRRTVLGGLTPLLPGQDGANGGLAGLLPDFEQYLKLKRM